ncbi:phage tail spike protein [Streptococcus mitis]|uniref:phage tail spike protein n=1 Tax=Streptococcus mitis TaxID=28037 RepID=UPI0035645DC9
MIYLTEGNIPLNAAYDDNITQEANSTYQLTFKFPTNNILWQRLREEAFLIADDLHGEQDFVIFEVEKKHGYIQVYANQVMTLLNHYVVNPINLDRTTGSTALSQFAGSITRENPFSFFSDIEDRHTFNTDTTNAMEALTKDKHSILGQWGGDLVRHSYQVRLLKNGGSENESLFMYKKNLSSYQHKTSTKSLKTRITFIATVKGEGEKAPDRKLSVVVDSPLINKYSQIYEDVVEVNDQDVKDEASLREYGKQYFRTTLCDMLEDSIEIDVIGQSDVPVQMFDVVGIYHEFYNLDVRKKITKYTYSPMAKKLKSIGFGQFQSGLANAIGNVVSDAFKSENQHFQSNFERQLARELKNADLAFERKKEELTNQFTDEVNAIKAKAEENKRALSDEINRKFHDFSPEGFEEAKAKAEEALKKAGASEDLAKEAKLIANNGIQSLNEVRDIATNNIVYLAEYKEQVNGRFANLSSQVAGKVNEVDFQRVRETAQLYERILGSSESDISRNASRLVMSSEIFQTEVGKYVTDDNNLIVNSLTMDKHTLIGNNNPNASVSVSDGVFTIKAEGLTGYNWTGFSLPIYVKKIYRDETYTLGFKYRIREYPDVSFAFNVKNHGLNKTLTWSNIGEDRPPLNEWQEVQKTFTMQEDFAFGEDKNYPFYIYLAKNGWIEFKEPILVRGSRTGPYKPSQFDDAYKITDEAKGLATDAQTRAIQIAQGLEATRTQVTQLAGSYAIQNLNSAGDIINGINLGANGNNRIIGKATHITGDTLIDNAVIKSAMIDKLKTANFEAGSVTTTILGAEAVTAEKVKFDTAFIQKLVSQQAFIDELFAKQATINRIQSIDFTGNNIKGGKISSLNGVTDFDLQTGWIEMNKEGVGIVNHFVGRPIQYLVFGAGAISNKPGSYTALMSNSNGRINMDDGSAGIQIWNTNDNTTAINLYGDEIAMMYNATDPKAIIFDNIKNEIRNVENVIIRNRSLIELVNAINENFIWISDWFYQNKLGKPKRYDVRF